MKTVRIVIAGILLGLGIIVLNSCVPTPLVTIEWEDDGNGFIQFQTNDPANTSQIFHILYPSTDHGSLDLSFPVEVITKKVIGSSGAAYGIIFCAVSDQNYFKILIKRDGYYKISKIVPGGESVLKDWVISNDLDVGLNTPNTIKVTWTDPGLPSLPYFTVAFNTVTVYTSFGLPFPGGQSGFFVTVSDALTEYFPTSMVDVRFRMLTPDTIPLP